MRLDIYKGDQLAARFVYGHAPRYYGPLGQQIETLLDATPVIYNLWTAETGLRPLVAGVDWWLASIISAPLARAGFAIRAT